MQSEKMSRTVIADLRRKGVEDAWTALSRPLDFINDGAEHILSTIEVATSIVGMAYLYMVENSPSNPKYIKAMVIDQVARKCDEAMAVFKQQGGNDRPIVTLVIAADRAVYERTIKEENLDPHATSYLENPHQLMGLAKFNYMLVEGYEKHPLWKSIDVMLKLTIAAGKAKELRKRDHFQ